MKFSLRIKKTYTTPLTQDEIISYVRSRRGKTRSVFCKENYFEGFLTDLFEVDIHKGNFWIFRRPSYWRGWHNRLKVSGRVTNANPTELEIKISPPYLVLFFLALPVPLLLLNAIMMNTITVNDVEREAGLLDRLFFFILATLPVLWCYFFVNIPIQKTERWLVDKLKLTEVNA